MVSHGGYIRLRRTLVAIVFVIVVTAPVGIHTTKDVAAQIEATVVLKRNLRLGDFGDDVRILQKFLNADERTLLTLSGPGAKGEETNYFGPLTYRALIRYQELYARDILYPLGLTRGTGYFGESTRAKLESLRTTASSRMPENDTSSQSAPTPFESFNVIHLQGPSQYELAPGSTLTLFGLGFTRNDNTVYFTLTQKIENIKSETGTHIVFTIPLSFPNGYYELWIENSTGKSANTTPVIVTAAQKQKPNILSITPARGPYGTEVTIYGSGFSTNTNTIRASYALIENIKSPDGTSISFQVLPFPDTEEIQDETDNPVNTDFPIWFYVVNDNGFSAQAAQFILES